MILAICVLVDVSKYMDILTWEVGLFFCVSCQPDLYHPLTQTKIVVFLGKRMSIPNLEHFPNRIPIELSRIAFPTIILPKDDHADFVQEERLGLPYWTMIWAICVLVDVSKCLDILTWDFFLIILEHLPFLTWV